MRKISTYLIAMQATLCAATGAVAEPKLESSSLTIESILKAGWEVAGYASNFDNRATFTLFKKSGETYLIQCLAGYDVTREPRVFRNCYELR